MDCFSCEKQSELNWLGAGHLEFMNAIKAAEITERFAIKAEKIKQVAADLLQQNQDDWKSELRELSDEVATLAIPSEVAQAFSRL